MTPLEQIGLVLQIHETFVDELNPRAAAGLPRERIFEHSHRKIMDIVERDHPYLELSIAELVIEGVADSVFGLGPVEPSMRDQRIEEIEVRGPHEIVARRGDDWEKTCQVFLDRAHVMRVIRRVAEVCGQPIGITGPVVDVEVLMADDSRFRAWEEGGELRMSILRFWATGDSVE